MRCTSPVAAALRAAAALAVVAPLLGSMACPHVHGAPLAGDAGDAGDARDDAPDGVDVEVAASAPRVRLLSGAEYRATVEDLLGVPASSSIDHADRSTGYDSGAGATLDENTFSVLYTEAERLADVYVNERIAQDFACFDRASVRDACIAAIVDTLGTRAFRRPLSPAARADLIDATLARIDEDDPAAAGACDPVTQPEGHFGMRDGRCRASCGALGGTNCPTSPAASGMCAEGTGPVGLAYDCDVCCGPGGLDAPFVDTARVDAVKDLVVRILMSARFLYRTEAGAPAQPGAPSSPRTLDAFERASLLSYALTGSMPDDALFGDAIAGALDEARTRAHVRRLLASERGRARVTDFVKQWARLRTLDDMASAPEAYGKLASRAQAEDLRDEVSAFTASTLLDGSGTLRELLTASHGFVGPDSAGVYGVDPATLGAPGEALTRVEHDPAQRAGLFTLAGVMAAHATANDVESDRPVKRGLLVLNQLLCGTVGPPSGIDIAAAGQAAAAAHEDFATLTTRDQLTIMMQQDAVCMDCHATFMPYGFAFGHYDGLGAWRTHQRGWPIDAHVDDVFIDDVEHSFVGAVDLMHGLAGSEQVARCFAKQWVSYTLGASAGPDVETLSAALAEAFIAGGTDVPELIEETLAHPSLTERRLP